MPKFWAKDYLAEALQQQRATVERMSLAPPAHIEIVDCYAHRGEVDDVHYTMPWAMVSPDSDPTLHTHSHALLESVHAGLQKLMAVVGSWQGSGGVEKFVGGNQLGSEKFLAGGMSGGGGGVRGGVGMEGYSVEDSGSETLFSDGEEEGGAAYIGLTQEIDSAVERVMSSMMSSPGREGGRGTGGLGEEFAPESLRGWERNTTPEVAEHFLEDHKSPSHLPSLLSALPRVADLAARLKPKLISDPLLSPTSGQPYSYMYICKSDFKLNVDDTTTERASPSKDDDSPSTTVTAQLSDNFSREEIRFTDDAVDPVLELHIASPPQPLLGLSPSDSLLLPPLSQLLPSPDREGEAEEEMDYTSLMKPEEDLSALVSEAGENAQRQDQQLQFSSPAARKPGHENFVKLNNIDVSHDSDDSGIGHALLESPCLPHHLSSSSPPSLPPSLPAQLARLEPMPVSPHSPQKLVLLSPVSEGRILAQLQEESKGFDNVLALTLPYVGDGSGSHLEALLKSYNALNRAVESFNIHSIHLTGDSELALPWDPLASSYQIMAAAQRRLVCMECPLEAEDRGAGERLQSREEFQKDVSVKTLGGGLSDTAIQMVEGGDLPSLSTAPPGYIQPRHTGDTKPTSSVKACAASPLTTGRKRGSVGKEKDSRSRSLLQFELGTSPLDMFIMLRSGTLSPEIARKTESGRQSRRGEASVNEPESQMVAMDSQEEQVAVVNSPTVQDVYLTREYQIFLSKVSHYGTPLMQSLQAHGLHTTTISFSSLDPDDTKFFLKQQQKLLADSHGSDEEGVLLQSCKMAVCLYILVSFTNGVANISLATGIRRFTFLNEKYEELIGNSLDLVKQDLADMQLNSRQQSIHHPKLQKMISVVNTWRITTRKHKREKALVVVGNEFSTVSGDILDFLQSIPELQSCVFSFSCDSPSNPMYLEALEERFNHYDCLVVPLASIANTFPWEKVSLLVEYEPLSSSLFPEGQLPACLQLKQWAALRTVQDISASSLALSGSSSTQSSAVMLFQYVLIASENVTTNAKLLQLLESRFNMLLISREYETLKKKMVSSLSYADLIVDQTTGIIVHPLSILSSDAGVHTVSTRATALSLQYERLWIILRADSENSYPYGGSVPLNLARLHASVAHYCPRQDAYQVKVMCASGYEEAAQLVRSITEETHKKTEGVGEQDWSDREWIADDFDMHEKFLLSFPCLNSFSAQLMLRKCPVGEILALDASQLQQVFPWLPPKVLKFLDRMCHANFRQSLPPPMPYHGGSECWDNSGNTQYHTAEPALHLDESLQYVSDEGNTHVSSSARQHQRSTHFTDDVDQPEETFPFADGMVAPLSSEDDSDHMTATAAAYPPVDPEASDMYHNNPSFTGESSSEFNLTSHAPNFHPVQTVQEESRWFKYSVSDLPPELHSTVSRAQSVHNTTAMSSFSGAKPSMSSSAFERSSTLKVPSQKQIRSSVITKLSAGQHSSTADNIASEYYGSESIPPPKFLTSGMVRRTPSRQPIKSLDLGLSSSGSSKAPQPPLQTNDRAAALYSSSSRPTDASFPASIPGSPKEHTGGSEWGRMRGVSDLMAFHSRQSLDDERGRGGRFFASDAALRSSTMQPPDSRVPRPKRPLSSNPSFDCQVPTSIISPHNDSDSSLYSFHNVSLGSIQLSPMKRRKLVYKRLPSSLDGQTKLAFE